MRTFGYLVLALAMMALMPGVARADGTLSDLRRLELSRGVFLHGVAEGDPLLVVAAARLRGGLAPVRIERAPEGVEIIGGAEPMSAHDMLRVASDLARGSPSMASVIAQARRDLPSESIKGLQNGPAFSAAAIAAKKVDKYPGLTFVGGRFAEVYIEGQGKANLDLFVYDHKGRLVCSDTDVSDFAHCGWYPQATTTYTVQVINKGGGGSQYTLATN